MKSLGIHQSQYLPWPPYFRKMCAVDVFIVLDDVQYQKNGVQNRNKIRNSKDSFWLTVPIGGALEETIREKRMQSDHWRMKHWKSLEASYSRALNWEKYREQLKTLYEASYETLHHVNYALLCFFVDALGISTEILIQSELTVSGNKSELILNCCKCVDASIYVTGSGGRSYLDQTAFRESGIDIRDLPSCAPRYSQGETPFIEGLSMLDMLLHAPEERILEYLSEGA